jgi:hypothetical protein
MFEDITGIEELNRRRTELLDGPGLTDEMVAQINKNFSSRRRQLSLSQRGKTAFLMPYRIITNKVTDPSITADAVFNPDAMLLTVIEPADTPFIRDTDRIPVRNQIEVTLGGSGNPTVVYPSFS